MEEVQHFQVAKSEGVRVYGRDPAVHELEMWVEALQKLAIANKLCHAILDEEVIELKIVLTPSCDNL